MRWLIITFSIPRDTHIKLCWCLFGIGNGQIDLLSFGKMTLAFWLNVIRPIDFWLIVIWQIDIYPMDIDQCICQDLNANKYITVDIKLGKCVSLVIFQAIIAVNIIYSWTDWYHHRFNLFKKIILLTFSEVSPISLP